MRAETWAQKYAVASAARYAALNSKFGGGKAVPYCPSEGSCIDSAACVSSDFGKVALA